MCLLVEVRDGVSEDAAGPAPHSTTEGLHENSTPLPSRGSESIRHFLLRDGFVMARLGMHSPGPPSQGGSLAEHSRREMSAPYSASFQQATVKVATFNLCGGEFMYIDSPIKHGFSITRSTSIFAECESDAEIEDVFGRLSAGGQVLMRLDNYGFSKKFGWVKDRFGPSWQLNLA